MANIFNKLKKGLSRTKSQVFDKITRAVSLNRKIDEDLLEEIEEILITGDVGVEPTLVLLDQIRRRVKKERVEDSSDLIRLLKEEMTRFFPEHHFSEDHLPARPYVILVVGVNGTGKTTSIAKLAYRFKKNGKSVLLAAADTFRAAAIEQLEIWANRVGVEMIKHQSGSDPAAVAFDAVQAARARNKDVLIIDTAGRLHTKTNLMEELRKIKRVIQKVIPEAPQEVWLVLDATIGQNAIQQAKQFVEATGVTGIILTKLDGTAKGGAILGIAHQLKIPVYYVGLGETIEDLEPFDPGAFVEGLFENSYDAEAI